MSLTELVGYISIGFSISAIISFSIFGLASILYPLGIISLEFYMSVFAISIVNIITPNIYWFIMMFGPVIGLILWVISEQ